MELCITEVIFYVIFEVLQLSVLLVLFQGGWYDRDMQMEIHQNIET